MPHRLDIVDMPLSREGASLKSVDRAVYEMRRARTVVIIAANGAAALAIAGEGLSETTLTALIKDSGAAAGANGVAELVITRRRAIRLGLAGDTLGDGSMVLAISFDGTPDPDRLLRLADPMIEPQPGDTDGARVRTVAHHGPETAAVGLAKIARLLPACMVMPLVDSSADDVAGWAARHDLQLVDAGDVFQFEKTAARTLRRVSEAHVPLEDAEDARVIAYRPSDGGIEHLAIVIGDPHAAQRDHAKPALIRLHSECFTGDLLGSLRCDCGDQLRGAIATIAAQGSGVLLYLAQEGRGIGLVNKLRAYTLQDGGLDTLEANEELGFDADERVYLPAAQMLKDLKLKQVRLLTNNPDKVTALSTFGIDVVERVAHHFPANKHNERYLEAKKVKGGHLF